MSEKYNEEDKRRQAWNEDITMTRSELSLEGEKLPTQLSEDLIHEVDEFLAQGELQSSEELDLIVQKLDIASAINNDPKAKELRAELFQKFGK